MEPTTTLTLTPAELAVLTALAGIGMAAMTNQPAMADAYRVALTDSDTEQTAITVFQMLLTATEQASQGAV